MAQKANLVIDQGADFSTTINVTDENGDIVDLTSYTGVGQIRKHYSSLTKTDLNINLSVGGILTLGLSANASNALEPGRYVYDVELTSSLGDVIRIIEGIVTITPSVTR
jgi:hypothetical protein